MVAAGATMVRRRDTVISVAFAASTTMFAVEVWAGFAFNSSSLHASAADFLADTTIYATSLFGMGLSARSRLRAALLNSAISLLAGIATLASSLYHFAAVATPHGHAMALIGFAALLVNSAVTTGLGRIRNSSGAINCSDAYERLGALAAIAAGAAICATGSRWPDLATGWIAGGLAVSAGWQGLRQTRRELRAALVSTAGLVLQAAAAEAHAIAGNRLFPGTLTFDDPAVTDEFTGPFISSGRLPAALGGTDRDTTISASITRLLWSGFAIGAGSAWTAQDRGTLGSATGFGPTQLGFKGLLYEDDPHETLVSGSLAWGVAGLGNPTILDTPYNVITPNVLFGRGLGDLPDRLSWLRPFGITGSLSTDLPTSHTSRITPAAPLLGNPTVVHTGIAVQFSTLYLTDRFTPGQLPAEEPLNQWVPLVEFQADTSLGGGYGRKTAATMNPGISYVFDTYQLSIEAIVPLTRAGGSGVGIRAGVIFFIDDLVPSLFGKPVFR